jgi:hypothetical protein
VGRLVTYRVPEDFDHFAAVLCNYNVRGYQNQAFLQQARSDNKTLSCPGLHEMAFRAITLIPRYYGFLFIFFVGFWNSQGTLVWHKPQPATLLSLS